MLKMNDCQVKTCLNGQSALDSVNSLEPNVLILDIGLPDTDGCTLLPKIRERCPQPTFAVALTGFGHGEAIANTKEAGFDLHMAKPVDFDTLLTTITNGLRKLSRNN